MSEIQEQMIRHIHEHGPSATREMELDEPAHVIGLAATRLRMDGYIERLGRHCRGSDWQLTRAGAAAARRLMTSMEERKQ